MTAVDHGPRGIIALENVDGLKYLKFSFMESDRWVFDVMFMSGFRATYNIREGVVISHDSLHASIIPAAVRDAQVSRLLLETIVEFVLTVAGKPVSLRSAEAVLRGEDMLQVWARCALAVRARDYQECPYELMLEMLGRHYGLDD